VLGRRRFGIVKRTEASEAGNSQRGPARRVCGASDSGYLVRMAGLAGYPTRMPWICWRMLNDADCGGNCELAAGIGPAECGWRGDLRSAAWGDAPKPMGVTPLELSPNKLAPRAPHCQLFQMTSKIAYRSPSAFPFSRYG